ncbi:probable polygalacturonase At2g43860 [Prunus persica]|uniref:probable polygalacturonase At2g43860 n=1 Tax=Prunus persica TaxID=3760 RepID=UPI0009AB3F36|nr:probable polygalacturonase At2g43860 [Prunus persica]
MAYIRSINQTTFNVLDYGAVGDGQTDDSKISGVGVSDVKYIDFQATSASEEAIKFDCSKILGCVNIVMNQINIALQVAGKEIHASCNNVNGTSSATIPVVPHQCA